MNFARNYEKKIILGTRSDPWLMSRLSHRVSKPVYYIVDCRISRVHFLILDIIYFKVIHAKRG